MTRIESPNSINTYTHCPRKYYYTYKLNLPRKESLATITGKTVHSTIEKFYNLNTEDINEENYIEKLQEKLITIFNQEWTNAIPSLSNLTNNKEEIKNYYNEALGMLSNFLSRVINDLSLRTCCNETFTKAFETIKPITEVYVISNNHKVHGYIDAIHVINGEVILFDYKTSKNDFVTEEYIRQLSLYALLYLDKFGKRPVRVNLHFLRHGTIKGFNVDDGILDQAKKDCQMIHKKTISDDIKDYSRNLGNWCNGNGIKCDFYEVCFGVKKLNDFCPSQETHKDS